MNKGPSVRRNIVANAVGQGWSGLLGIVLIPVYIKLLGVESYGLIGLFVTVQGALTILDFGLAGTINRELARGSQGAITVAQIRDLLRTFEWVYWPIALAIAGLSIGLGPFIAGKWLTPVELSAGDVARALTLMGVVVAAQWPASLYAGALTGLQHQGLLNSLVVIFSTLRSAGVIVPLLMFDATITVFFAWQLVISVLQTAVFAAALWWKMPDGASPAFSRSELARVWRFAGGIAGMAITSFLLLQLDRLILAYLLDLKAFGYYATAAALATVIPRLVAPVAAAVYPRYSQLVAARNESALHRLYHKTNQLVAILLAIFGALVFFYAESVLHLWTGSADVAAAASMILRLLVMGSVFAGLSNLPYSLQLAYGNPRLSLALTALGLCVYAPVLWIAANAFGALGAAWVWLGLHLSLLLIGVHLMHRSMLKGEEATWYMRDVIPVFAAAFAVGLVLHAVWAEFPRTIGGSAMLSVATVLVAAAALLAARDVRADAVSAVRRRFEGAAASRRP